MISINVNPAASRSGLNLGKSQEALAASLERLSSGRRIVDPSDDAGGLAVHMKMAAAQKRTEATAINLRNAVSYLEVQDGAFQVADKVSSRMSELFALARDITKNAGDVENYDKEITNLKAQLVSLATEKFNGVALFEGGDLTVPTSEDGSQTTGLTSALINTNPMLNMMIKGFRSFEIDGRKFIAPIETLTFPKGSTDPLHTYGGSDTGTVRAFEIPGGINSAVTLNIAGGTATVTPIPTSQSGFLSSQAAAISAAAPVVVAGAQTNLNYGNSDEYSFLSQEALQEVADMRAQNGAEMSRIKFAEDMLQINAVNLDAANSRIIDVDVAAESSQLARYQILQQAGVAMLSQANTSQQALVRLLQG
jgi:flagellin-like hook-associated protein FlgL